MMPALIAPKKARTKSSLFGKMRATRSPLRSPSAWSAPPKRALSRSTSAYDRTVSGDDTSAAGDTGAGNPWTPLSCTKDRPRRGSALAASSMAWGIVRNAIIRCDGFTRGGLPYQGAAGRGRKRRYGSSSRFDRQSSARHHRLMPLIETEEAARRLARAIASDLSLYNEDKIVGGVQNDNLFESLSEEIEEGRALYKRRVSPDLYPRNYYDRALVDILIKAKGHIKSKLW